MKPIFFAAIVGFVLMPPGVNAQYSNASLNGAWIEDNGANLSYLIFDGNSKIISLGTSDESDTPVGVYSVQPGGSFMADMHLKHGNDTITGTLTSAQSATIYINASGPYSISAVTNPAALADTFAGTMYDSSSQQVKDIEIAIDNTGAVSSVGGSQQLSGKMFSRQGSFAGYLTGNDPDCVWQKIQLWGSFWNNVLQGPVELGSADSTACFAKGGVFLSKKSTLQTAVADVSAPALSVYPNPFYNEVEVTGLLKGNNYNLTLTDVTGRIIARQSVANAGNTVSLDVDGRASGVYILRLDDGRDVSVLKLVKHE